MILTEKQQKGLEIAVRRFKAGKPWTCIAGLLPDKSVEKFLQSNLTKLDEIFLNYNKREYIAKRRIMNDK